MSAPPPILIDPIIDPTSLFANPLAITDEVAAVSVTPGPRPAYLQPLQLPGYGTKITRICGDAGTAIPNLGGTWGRTVLHHYSKDQPWNHDMSMIYIEQRKNYDGTAAPASSPSKIILDGSSYLPIIGNKYSTNNNDLLNASSEFRWRPMYADQAIGWNNNTQILTVYRLVSQQILFQAHIPHACIKGHAEAYGEGLGLHSEGVISNNGRYLVIASRWRRPQVSGHVDQFCVVDIEAGIAGVHYANSASTAAGVGPWVNAPMPYPTTDSGNIDFCSISPLGNYVIVKYSADNTPEYARCFNVNQSTLVCTPRTFITGDSPLFSGGPLTANPDDFTGWMACMSHGDFGISSDAALAGPVEVYVGGMRDAASSNHCSSAHVAANGSYVAQSMATGKHIHVSMGTGQLGGASESADQHASCRSYMTPEWLLGTHEHHATKKFGQYGGEIVLWELLVNGDGAPVRCGCTFTDDSDLGALGGNAKYLGEAHAVASPGCEKIMFGSNWKYGSPAGPVGDYKSYILEPASTQSVAASDYVRRPEEPQRYSQSYRLSSTDEGE